jgi:hypothetical protein
MCKILCGLRSSVEQLVWGGVGKARTLRLLLFKVPYAGFCRALPEERAIKQACADTWVQSITFDEARSYLEFAAGPWPAHWTPDAGNHVLNTALVRLFTSIFGLSPFTTRIPALTLALFGLRPSGGQLVSWWAKRGRFAYFCIGTPIIGLSF